MLVVDVYPEVDDRVTFLRNLATALKPGGRIGIVNYKPGEGGPGPETSRVDAPASKPTRARPACASSRARHLPYQYLLVLGGSR